MSSPRDCYARVHHDAASTMTPGRPEEEMQRAEEEMQRAEEEMQRAEEEMQRAGAIAPALLFQRFAAGERYLSSHAPAMESPQS